MALSGTLAFVFGSVLLFMWRKRSAISSELSSTHLLAIASIATLALAAACSDPQTDIRHRIDRLELERKTIRAERAARLLERKAMYVRLRAVDESAAREAMTLDAQLEHEIQQSEAERLEVIVREISALKDKRNRLQCEQWIREGRSYPVPANAMTWGEVLGQPAAQGLSRKEIAAMKRQYFLDVIAPIVPTNELHQTWCLFDRRAPNTPTGSRSSMNK